MARWILCVSLAVLVVGCNTVAGVGRDLERGGEAIQRSAR
jgi:entericidin B